MNCISADIIEFGNGALITPLGYMKAHRHDLERHTDTNEMLVLDLCDRHRLETVNPGHKSDGRITWEVEKRQWNIDYCLTTEGIYDILREIRIHEQEISSLGSDLKHIRKMGCKT